MPDWAGGYTSRLFEGFLDFQRMGAPLELHFDQPSGGDLPPMLIDQDWQGDGLLVYRYSARESKAWEKAGIAVVNLSAEMPKGAVCFPRVTVDNHLLGQIGAEHLAALGLHDFAFIHEPNRLYSALRLESMRQAVEKLGGRFHQIDVPASSFPIPSRPLMIENCMRDQILALPRPCGLLAKDDIAAVWAARILRQLGIHCPKEMPLLGISDDIIFCHTTHPPLSSIPYPGRKIGLAATDLLDRMMRGENIAADLWLSLPPDPVVSRESTSHVSLDDKAVSAALNFLRSETPHRSVTVAELSRVAGLSREGLRQRFIATLGHSPKKEIERMRVLIVIDQLRNTENTLETIAFDHGFGGPDEICRIIKRSIGKTPGQIRREARI